jgi:outer membrane protein OmpA-like peptidoglycan-associated protein
MSNLNFEQEPFEFEADLDELELDLEDYEQQAGATPCPCCQERIASDAELYEDVPDVESQSEVKRGSKAYIRWLQQALNQALGLRLTTDGIMGPQTRSAIRAFQRRRGLSVDGVVGAAIERALVDAGVQAPTGAAVVTRPDVIKPAAARLDGFDFDRSELEPAHKSVLDGLAGRIAGTWVAGQPIVTVRVVGHTDPEGSAQHNLGLGLRRALAVRKELMRALERKQRNLSAKVLILASSKGESERVDMSGAPEGQARNRRVEVFLSTRALQPIRPRTAPPPRPTFQGKVPVIVADLKTPRLPVEEGCRAAEFERLKANCNKQYAKEAVTAWAVGYLRYLLATTKAAPCLERLPNVAAVALCAAPKVGPEIAKEVTRVYRRVKDANAERLKCIEAAGKFTNCPK